MKVVKFIAIVIVAALSFQNCDKAENEILPDDLQPEEEEVEVKFEGFDLTFKAGDYWEFYWLSESEFVAEGSNTASTSVGNFSITLGQPQSIEGIEAFAIQLTGDNLVRYPGPQWKYLASHDNMLLGSTSGDSLEVIFNARDGAWEGGGFFAHFDRTSIIEASVAPIENEYISVESAIAANYQQGQTVCEIIIDQRICANDEDYLISVTDYFKSGIGPVGYSNRYSVFDQGGNVLPYPEALLRSDLLPLHFNHLMDLNLYCLPG